MTTQVSTSDLKVQIEQFQNRESLLYRICDKTNIIVTNILATLAVVAGIATLAYFLIPASCIIVGGAAPHLTEISRAMPKINQMLEITKKMAFVAISLGAAAGISFGIGVAAFTKSRPVAEIPVTPQNCFHF